MPRLENLKKHLATKTKTRNPTKTHLSSTLKKSTKLGYVVLIKIGIYS